MNLFVLITNVLTVAVCAIVLSGCGHEGLTIPVAPPETTSAPQITATSAPTPVPTVSVTYFSKSRTVTPNSGQPTKTYTATGYCAVVNSQTFCWDDGVKTITFIGGAVGHYTYWGLSCNGTCATDVAASPVLTDQSFTNHILTGVTISGVLSGSPTTVSCTDNAGVYDCGTFSIDTNQSPF